jgi:hypothetical protein
VSRHETSIVCYFRICIFAFTMPPKEKKDPNAGSLRNELRRAAAALACAHLCTLPKTSLRDQRDVRHRRTHWCKNNGLLTLILVTHSQMWSAWKSGLFQLLLVHNVAWIIVADKIALFCQRVLLEEKMSKASTHAPARKQQTSHADPRHPWSDVVCLEEWTVPTAAHLQRCMLERW